MQKQGHTLRHTYIQIDPTDLIVCFPNLVMNQISQYKTLIVNNSWKKKFFFQSSFFFFASGIRDGLDK